jgi:hypothetical protein
VLNFFAIKFEYCDSSYSSSPKVTEKRIDRLVGNFRHQSDDRARVDPARQKRTEANITYHSSLDGSEQELANTMLHRSFVRVIKLRLAVLDAPVGQDRQF